MGAGSQSKNYLLQCLCEALWRSAKVGRDDRKGEEGMDLLFLKYQ